MSRLVLGLLVGNCIGCAGSAAMPMVQVPLQRRAGQVEAGLVVAPASNEPELGGTVRVAATDIVRVGASVSGATRHRDAPDERGGDEEHTPRLFTDGFIGAEWGGLLIRYGVLAGGGYGRRSQVARRCAAASEPAHCTPGDEGPARDTGFVRSYGQLHLALAPPGPLMTSFAVRVPVVVDLPTASLPRETTLDTEFALTQTIQVRDLRLDLQPQWSTIRGFAFHLAFLFRFTPPARTRQTVRASDQAVIMLEP